ncbi:MAG: MATE family efflux transporter [Clostridia bacterium]|nr:MATE family efflux transporter [Clostridia bacterium]
MAYHIRSRADAAAEKNGRVDVCGERLAKNLILYTLPLMASGILQVFFNAADSIVVGRYAENGATALAAVGSTGSLVNLIINLLLGLSVGTSVAVAHCYGSRDDKGVFETVHTSVMTAALGGVLVGLVGFFFCRTFLAAMSTPPEIIDQATVYMKIYFAGLPAMMIYNFSSAILRSVGDTRHPLIFLVTGGVANVLLNLFFVLVLKLDVEGVAFATVISQTISASLSVAFLMRVDGPHKLYLKKLRIYFSRLKMMMKIGIPAGLQGTVFSFSNMVIQSSVNSFGHVFVTGNSAAQNIEGFIYIAMNSFYHTSLTFVGQHVGAGKPERIRKIAILCLTYVSVTGLALGLAAYAASRTLLGIYIPSSAQAVSYGVTRMSVICSSYFICGIMDCFTGFLRGMGSSFVPMMISLTGACGFRLIWIFTVFASDRTPTVLFLSYPVSWAISVAAQMTAYFIIKKKTIRKITAAKAAAEV